MQLYFVSLYAYKSYIALLSLPALQHHLHRIFFVLTWESLVRTALWDGLDSGSHFIPSASCAIVQVSTSSSTSANEIFRVRMG